MDEHQLILLRRAFRIQRYHTVPLIRPQTVGEHTAGVIALACYLNGSFNEELMKAALYHDIAELSTGDIPANVKVENPQMAEAVKTVEARYRQYMPNLTPEHARILAAADTLECVWKCSEEMKMGNENLYLVRKRAIRYLNEDTERVRIALSIATGPDNE